jgi:hypothetical protein
MKEILKSLLADKQVMKDFKENVLNQESATIEPASGPTLEALLDGKTEAVSSTRRAESRRGPFPGYTLPASCTRALDAERRPLRMPGEFPAGTQVFEPSNAGPFQVTASVANDGELALILTMRDRGVSTHWDGTRRFTRFFPFCRCTDRVLITFSETEWGCLKELLGDVWARPGFQPIRDRLSLDYGEI